MTTINPMSTLGTTAIVMPSDLNDGWTYVASAGHYKTPDLLAALNAIPESKDTVAVELHEEWAEQFAAVKAERDALAKTVERVRETAKAAKTRGWQWKVKDFAEQIEKHLAALDPEPAFVLPTEVPARIVAVKSSTGDEKELTLFTDGDTAWWADIEDWGPFWTRSQVMDQFTDHRLLGAAE